MITIQSIVLFVCLINMQAHAKPTSSAPSATKLRPFENPDLVEGDMVFPTDQLNGRGVAKRGSSVPWPNGVVPYEIASGYADNDTAFIEATMRKMERLIAIDNINCVSFRPKEASDPYFITITNGGGCSSPVGMNAGSSFVRRVTLQHPGCLEEAIIMHELLHTLGFYHEQSRPDRDNYIRVNYGNIWGGMEHNFDKYSNAAVDMQDTPYDYASVMHYDRTAFSWNGEATIEPIQPNVFIGQRDNLSDIDILEVRLFYNCSGINNTVTRIPTTTPMVENLVNTSVSSALTTNSGTFARYPYGSSSCYFEAYLVNVTVPGIYTFMSLSSINTVGYMYINNFSANEPSRNLIAYNDDNDSGDSQFELSLNLQPDTPFYAVVTTYYSGQTGSYTLVASGPGVVNFALLQSTTNESTITSSYSSQLTSDSPTYDRTGSNPSYRFYYEAIQLNVSSSGYYTLISENQVDTYGYLYADSFDPMSPTWNMLARDDDGGGNLQFRIVHPLTSSNSYILVFTTYSQLVQTPISVSARGPGEVRFLRLSGPISTPPFNSPTSVSFPSSPIIYTTDSIITTPTSRYPSSSTTTTTSSMTPETTETTTVEPPLISGGSVFGVIPGIFIVNVFSIFMK